MRRSLQDLVFIFPIGAAGYSLLEMLWRGFTHWSMALVGGLCFCLIYMIFVHRKRRSFVLSCLYCALCVTAVEFASGCIFNLRLGLGVWDYSDLPLHLLGQICLPYSVLWFLLAVPLGPLSSLLSAGIGKLKE